MDFPGKYLAFCYFLTCLTFCKFNMAGSPNVSSHQRKRGAQDSSSGEEGVDSAKRQRTDTASGPPTLHNGPHEQRPVMTTDQQLLPSQSPQYHYGDTAGPHVMQAPIIPTVTGERSLFIW